MSLTMSQEDILDRMRELLAINIQNLVVRQGFFPDDCGDGVKAILSGGDEVAMMALGCYLEECEKSGSYWPLRKGLKSIAEGQRRRETESLR